jgi:hypothetical protein
MLLIPLNDIYFTQEHFRNKDQIRAIAKTIKEGGRVKKIELFVQGGKICVYNGHHRAAAYYLAGRSSIYLGKYKMIKGHKKCSVFENIPKMVTEQMR